VYRRAIALPTSQRLEQTPVAPASLSRLWRARGTAKRKGGCYKSS